MLRTLVDAELPRNYSLGVLRWCTVAAMSISRVLLGLLEAEPQHGYALKQDYDERFGLERPVLYGQVYATLGRLQRDGLARAVGVESGGGPDRKLYAITSAGVTELEQWLSQPEPTSAPLQNVLFAKVVLALMSGRPADQLLDAQRTVHVARMRELTARRHDADITERLATDFEIHHLEADLKWIETAGSRLDRLRTAVTR
ncbi:PadR family transcriptional regulator [Acidothermaceae bacterium B102]|nr:PadR family transcriptional regulator [Acidothermaceae bacterium B102]